jgi:hypothetical protein
MRSSSLYFPPYKPHPQATLSHTLTHPRACPPTITPTLTRP